MSNLKARSLLLVSSLAVLGAGATVRAEIITEPIRYFSIGSTLEDLQDPPLTFLSQVTDSAIASLTEVRVGLRLVGVEDGFGFASEMFVSLNKDLDATSILLNRVGTSENNEIGFFYNGWDVTFADAAPNGDVHNAKLLDGTLQGLWQPDGPILDASPGRPGLLDVFKGQSGNGDWRLAVADLGLGGQMRLDSWSLTLTGETEAIPSGVPVPEMDSFIGAALLILLILTVFNDKRSAPPGRSSLGARAMRRRK